ncbi:hypothetical protein HELRODRAFT_165072 [Helobdella robusta]|uniref:Uncharacterized protein n=1 Tax=Helobdella robusta TaxID=6412 RepID=T1EW91_HELRO|nr:hypothetical protein HELRODRAFT_165072 [Helobdella robusta]ESN92934.1 hypothetical protein HELRODRAFT_165072 [Helobdella robusta]
MLNKLGGSESDLNDKMQSLKHDVKSTFASVVSQEVKKNVDVLNAEVKNVHKTLIEASDVKDRETNIMLFRLPEGVNDKERVFKILNHLTDDAMSDKNVLKIVRLGKKTDGTSRPLLIMLDNIAVKSSG